MLMACICSIRDWGDCDECKWSLPNWWIAADYVQYDRSLSLFSLGTILFIPGAYYSHKVYCAWRDGHRYDEIDEHFAIPDTEWPIQSPRVWWLSVWCSGQSVKPSYAKRPVRSNGFSVYNTFELLVSLTALYIGNKQSPLAFLYFFWF